MNVNKTQKEWLEIHNRAAWVYINSEWSRENLFGVAKRKQWETCSTLVVDTV